MNTLREEKAFQYQIEHIVSNNAGLALHSWIPNNPKGIIFYIHGIQSHAGWLFETGPDLAYASIAIFVLDRRGSGLSEGVRGDIPSSEILLEDYYFALKKVRQAYPALPLSLLGHSLGGSILAGLLSWPKFEVSYDSAIFCASALGKNHLSLSQEEIQKILSTQTMDRILINLEDEAFTNDAKYLQFMKQDKLCGKSMTARTRASLVEIESLYFGKKEIINKPSAYLYPSSDPLVNISASINIFEEISGNKGITLQLPANKHYLWFTEQRHALTSWLSHYVISRGYQIYV